MWSACATRAGGGRWTCPSTAGSTRRRSSCAARWRCARGRRRRGRGRSSWPSRGGRLTRTCQNPCVRSGPPSVGRHEDEHLRRFLLARRAGDAEAMRRWWEELVIDFHDRIDGLIAVTHKGRLDELEHQDAVQRALTKFSEKLIGTFRGTSMGELVNATRQLCHFVCVDVQREAVAYRRRHSSLDAGGGRWDDDGPAPAWEADAAREAYERQEHEADVDAFLAWALPQLLESRRAVVERTFDRMPLPQICAELGLTRANAYQRRCRG